FVSLITGALVWLLVVVSLVTLPLTILVIRVVQRDRTYATNTFFTIYNVGLVFDIIAMLCVHLVGSIPSRGWLLAAEIMETQLYMKLFYFTINATHAFQNFIFFGLCINRATAVLLPLHHHK
ncbi:hypothetical protein PFISCL1PPCAC_13845, partial [Pristionchus fissidentatus]